MIRGILGYRPVHGASGTRCGSARMCGQTKTMESTISRPIFLLRSPVCLACCNHRAGIQLPCWLESLTCSAEGWRTVRLRRAALSINLGRSLTLVTTIETPGRDPTPASASCALPNLGFHPAICGNSMSHLLFFQFHRSFQLLRCIVQLPVIKIVPPL